MSKLITIAGYENTYDDLIKADYKTGDYVNVLDGNPFRTFVKTGSVQVGELGIETDVIGWYETKEALEAGVPNPNDGDIYIFGKQAPYTRRKAVVRGIDVQWKDDGEYLYKIVKKFKSKYAFRRETPEPQEGLYYSLGDVAPYQLYGLVSGWDEVGAYLSGINNFKAVQYDDDHTYGEVYFYDGIFYIYKEDEIKHRGCWKELSVCESFLNYGKHVYVQGEKHYKLREAPQLGHYEWYSPKE